MPARHLPAIATHASVWAVCSARRPARHCRVCGHCSFPASEALAGGWQAGREAQAMRAGVKAGLSWHGIYFAFTLSFVNCQLNFLPASPFFLTNLLYFLKQWCDAIPNGISFLPYELDDTMRQIFSVKTFLQGIRHLLQRTVSVTELH